MAARVAVIGAGISGLAAARALLRAGYEVQVFESSDRCGGLLGSEVANGFIIDSAASSFVPAEKGAVALAQELGVAMEEASSKARNRWVYIDGEMQVVPRTARQLLTSPLLSWRGKFRAMAEPLQPNHPGVDESIAAFCKRRLGSEVTRVLIAPFVTGVFGGNADELSLAACFPSLAALESRGGLLRGAAATKVEAVFSRMQGAATAKRGHRILAPIGGAESLVRALGEDLADCIAYNTTIASLERSADGLKLHTAAGAHHEVEAIVLATPARVSASLVAPHHSKMAEALRAIPYAPMAVVGIGFEKAVANPLNGFGFLVAKGEAPRTLGVTFESSVWSGRAPDGGTLLRCMMGGARDPKILDCSDEEIVKIALDDLKLTLQIDETPTYTRVIRWPRAIPQYTIGHLQRAAVVEEGARELGVVVAGSAIRGVSVNERISNGDRVVKAVAARLAAKASILVLLAFALSAQVACGASKKNTSAPGDAGQSDSYREPADAGFVPDPSLAADRGKVEVMARWLWPPAELRRSPGRNSCGVAREPALRVELMGGLTDTAVSASVGKAPGSALLSVSACQLQPALVVVGVGQSLQVQNLSESEHRVVVEEIDNAGKVIRKLGVMPMRVAGQRYAVPVERAGILRIHLSSDPTDFVYAVASAGSAVVTSNRGMAVLELPAGEHALEVWHAPVRAGKAAVTSKLNLKVEARVRSKKVVDLNL